MNEQVTGANSASKRDYFITVKDFPICSSWRIHFFSQLFHVPVLETQKFELSSTVFTL